MFKRLGFSSSLVAFLAFAITLSFVPILRAAAATGLQKHTLITQEVDETRVVPLKGNTRPEANAQNDRGAVDEGFRMEHMLLQLQRSPEKEQALEQFIDQLQDHASPNYHLWLTPQEFGGRFGLAPGDLDRITNWLQSHDLEVNRVYPSGMLIDFSGSAGQVREAFRTEIHNLEVNGARHIANMSDPQIPAALAPAVAGVVSMHDFFPRPMNKLRPNYTYNSKSTTYEAVVPADLATIYNLNPLFRAGTSGRNETIVVIEDSDLYTTSDWNTFRFRFGLAGYSSGSLTAVNPPPPSGPNNCTDPGANSDDVESILDAEYASAVAPNAAIVVAACANTSTTSGVEIAAQNIINESTPPPIVNISYYGCEAEDGPSDNASIISMFQQAVAEGISVFVAAGDGGAAACDTFSTKATHGIGVNALASTPYNVAVGGTDFGDSYLHQNSKYWNPYNTFFYGSAKSYIPEIPWGDSCASGLWTSYLGYSAPYGVKGFCNSSLGKEYFLEVAAGGGGPSGCASGYPAITGVVSGSCRGTPNPSWQSGVIGIPKNHVRNIPDVSMFAGDGAWGHYYVICYSDTSNGGVPCTGSPSNWAGAGGTSFSSVVMAGVQSLVDQYTGNRQGNPNPVYYQIAASEYGLSGNSACNSTLGNTVGSSCVFHDVTLGDNEVNCTGLINCYDGFGMNGVLSTSFFSFAKTYGTTSGWDFATGLGSVNAYDLVTNPAW